MARRLERDHATARPPSRDGVSPSCVALPSGPWATVLDFLAQRLPKVARDDWHARMQRGEVVDPQGLPVPPHAPYRPQTRLYYWRSLPTEPRIPFEERIVHQDEHIVVADKPHFLPVTPGGRYVQETLLVRLKRRLGIDTLVPAHRLDRDTAGLVLFTVRPDTRDAYQRLFRERQVAKVYEAVAPLRADLAFPLTRRSRLVECEERFMQMREAPGEPNAETVIELIRPLEGPSTLRPPASANVPQQPRAPHELAHYRLTPVTGQKHQLRAHMNGLGLPILHDRIYPVLMPEPPPGQEGQDHDPPLQLLARTLAFRDPITGRDRRFDSGRTLLMAPCPPPTATR